MRILFIHGLLHIMGFDHETDNGQMRQKEIEIATRFELSAPLTQR
jgi:probable rRNA maturation factor